MRAKLKVGSILICTDQDDEDEDLGASGIVLKGNRNLTLRREYEVISIDTRHVPADSERKGAWRDNTLKEFHDVQDAWLLVDLKYTVNGKTKLLANQWFKNFKIKK